jgi:hypothetical protein
MLSDPNRTTPKRKAYLWNFKKKLHDDTLKVNYFVSSHQAKLNVRSKNAQPCECHQQRIKLTPSSWMKLINCCYSPLNWLASNDGPSKLNWVILICSKVKPIQKYGPWIYVAFL